MPAFDYAAVADVYDRYVTAGFDIPFFVGEASRAGGAVLELMAGTGRISVPLLGAGIRLTCVDISGAMLAVLRKKLDEKKLGAMLVEQDVAHLSLPGRYGLAMIPFNSFSEITEAEGQLTALRSIRRCLDTNGRLIVTLHNPVVRRRSIDGAVHTPGPVPLEEGGGSVLVEAVEQFDARTGLVTGRQRISARRQDGSALWERVVDIRHRLVERGEFEGMARAAGYGVEKLYGDYDRSPFLEGSSPSMIWILRA